MDLHLTKITTENKIPYNCRRIICDIELNKNLSNLPSSCIEIILTKNHLAQFKYLTKLPFGCKIKVAESFIEYNLVKSTENDLIEVIENFGYLIDIQYLISHNKSILTFACQIQKNTFAKYIIKKFADLCYPQYVDVFKYTALHLACLNKMNEVAIMLIEKFGDLCNPQQVT